MLNYNYMVIYKKYNGELLYRANKNIPQYKIGQKTSMGWEVVDIKKMYKGKTYSISEFDNMLSRKYSYKLIINKIAHIDYTTLFKLLLIGVVLYIFIVKF